MNPELTIKKNLERRSPIVNENIVYYKNIPLPTWIELSLIDVCNRSCSFCPKSDDKVAPDTYNQMNSLLIDKLALDLKSIKYRGSIALCGYGEPLLHKDLNYIVKKLSNV
jgi:molybdenum cofactor biosynthesis enzyme MoaA